MSKPLPYPVPLCPLSKPCFTVCCSSGCSQSPFLCGYQGCRCHVDHQKCTKPLSWKQLYDAIRIKGSGTPELKAYFDTVTNTMHRIITDLARQKDKFVSQSMTVGLQVAQRDLMNAASSGRFELVTSGMLSQTVEELKYPSLQLTKTKLEIDAIIGKLNKCSEELLKEFKQISSYKVYQSESLTTSNSSSMNNSNGPMPSVPKINTIPPGLESNNPKPLSKPPLVKANFPVPEQKIIHQQVNQGARVEQPKYNIVQSPPPQPIQNIQPKIEVKNQQAKIIPPSHQAISISGTLNKINSSNPPPPTIITPNIQQPKASIVPKVPIVQPSGPSKQQTELKKFISIHGVELEIENKKHSPTNDGYSLSKVTYLKLKACSYIQAKLISKYLTNLTRLSLYNCHISKEGAYEISKLHKLIYLDLTGNIIGDTGLKAISEGIPTLEVLSLTGNEITDIGAQSISNNLKNLIELRLGFNKIGENGAIKIAENCQKLNSLDINNSKYSDETKETIRKLLPKKHLSL